jgi:release factor glutamine methyltransferase
LPPGGILALEIGETQGERVKALLTGSGRWTEARIERDLAGKDRYAMARRTGD